MDDKTIAVCRQKGHTRSTRFQQLWSMVEDLAGEKAELECRLDLLVMRMKSEVLPVELALATVCRQALERLLLFSERKTLSKGHRAALNPWIEELLGTVLDVDYLDDALRDRLARHHATVLDIAIDPDSESSVWRQLEVSLEQCEAHQVHARCGFAQTTEPSCEERVDTDCADSSGQCADDVERVESWQHGRGKSSDGAAGRAGLDEDVFIRLFRQTAAALHPDKEANEQRRQEKHVLMTRLLQARKDHDLITVMQLHERHSQTQCSLTGTDEKQLEEVLRQHLVVLRKQKDRLAERSFLHYMAYHRFHDKDSAVVDARIAEYTVRLGRRQHTFLRFLEQVRTLQQLRSRLHPDSAWLSALW